MALILHSSKPNTNCKLQPPPITLIPTITLAEGWALVYSRKTQANRRTIVHRGCSLYNNDQIMKYIISSIQFRQNKEKERGRDVLGRVGNRYPVVAGAAATKPPPPVICCEVGVSHLHVTESTPHYGRVSPGLGLLLYCTHTFTTHSPTKAVYSNQIKSNLFCSKHITFKCSKW